MDYDDFVIQLGTDAGAFTVRVARSPAGESDPEPLSLDLSDSEIVKLASAFARSAEVARQRRDLGPPEVTEHSLAKIGSGLFHALFTQTVRDRYQRSLGMVKKGRGLRLRIEVSLNSPSLVRLHAVPWEYLTVDRHFLALSRDVSIVRHLSLGLPDDRPPVTAPLAILVLAGDSSGLDLEKEKRHLEQAWNERGRVRLHLLPECTLDALREELLAREYHVLHFMGHGSFSKKTGEGELAFTEGGKRVWVSGAMLADHLRDRTSLRLVFLNACKTAQASAVAPFAGVATALSDAGIPIVLAIQYPISDDAALALSRTFYRRIARGDSVDAAVAEGRLAIRRLTPNNTEWGTPVLYERLVSGRIVVPQADPADGSTTLMKSLLMVVKESVDAIKMPLPSRDGHAVLLRSADFRVDLSFRFVHDHRPKREPSKSEPAPSLQMDGPQVDPPPHPVADLDLSFDRDRRSHTDLLHQERSARAESAGGNWSLSEHLGPDSRLIVWGDPGSGKSTLLDGITGHYAGAWLGEADGDAALPVQPWIPVLVACRDIVEALPIRNATELFEAYARRRQFNPDQVASIVSDLGQAMDSGSVLLMVDGIDEILDRRKRFEFCQLLRDIANRFSRVPIIATSRVIGLQDVRTELSDCFDFLEVLPLQRDTKSEYVGRWARLNELDDAATYDLIESVCYRRESSRLTDNILMLAMVSQLQMTRETASRRSIDVLRRAVQLMTERRHHMPGGSFESSAVIAYLEFLAYLMRKAGLQRYADNRVIRVFEDFRSASSDEPAFASVDPAPLLEACIHVFGLLNVAGIETDARGIDRRSIQFVHQLFQEYLAGQAIRHGHGAPTEQGVVARLRQYLDALQLEPREVVVSEHDRVTEWVVVGDWQEQIRSVLADLATSEADDAMQMILPGSDAPAAEARARAVFAMLCLAEDPRVSDRVASVVVDTAIDALIDEDASNQKINTSMGEAFAALTKSTFNELLRARLLVAFADGRGVRRLRAGRGFASVAALPQAQLTEQNASELLEGRVAHLRSDTATIRIGAALELMQLFFSVNGKLGFLPATLRDAILEGLTGLLREEEGSRCAALWALVWLTNAIYRGIGETAPGEVVGLKPMTAASVRACLSLGQLDPSFVPYACDALTREEGLRLVCHQQDWIYEMAVVADGGKPGRVFVDPAPTGADASTMELVAAQLRWPDLPETSRSRVALALGSLGVRTPEMVRPLRALFEDPRRGTGQRDEAMVYLALIGGAEARLALETAHATAPAGEDDYPFTRGLFGLLLLDDVEALAKHLRMALDHFDLRALARGLLGSRDPKGQELLVELERDGDQRVGAAIDAALAASWARDEALLAGLDGPREAVPPAAGSAAETVCILLVRGESLAGAPTFAYVAVRADKLSEFMKAQALGMFYPEDFGVIVASGEGEPSEEIRRTMETEYGFNHDGMVDIPDTDGAERIVEGLEGGLRPETD